MDSYLGRQMQFTEYVFDKIKMLIQGGAWPTITLERFNQWKRQLQPENIYYGAWMAYKLLYYNRKDFAALISWAYAETMRRIVFTIDTDLYNYTDAHWEELLSIAKAETLICPFAPDSPACSGNMVVRILRNQGILDERAITTIDKLEERLKSGKYRAVIFTDDIVGSGTQAREFFLKRNILRERDLYTNLRDILEPFSVYLAVALAPQQSIDELEELIGINIISAEILSNKAETLNPNFWFDEDFEQGVSFLNQLEENNGVPRLGFKENCWAVAFEHGIPDVASPFYGYSSTEWRSFVPSRGEGI